MSGGNTKDFLVMCELLDSLLDLSDHHWRIRKDLNNNDLDTRTTMRNYDQMALTEHPLARRKLDLLMKKSRNSRLCLDQFYLPPLEEDREFIPILSLKCDLTSSPPSLSLRVGMTKYTNGGKCRPTSVGFRFEMGKPNSNHNYHHMQFTARPHDEPLAGCPELPETYPCVLTPAKCPVSLFLCLLLSLYGSRITENRIFTVNIDRKYKVPLDYLL
jgi:hypothetical protein